MDNRIIKKPFFYKTMFNRTYCSICGKLVPGDFFNMKKHLKLHHGIENPEVICMRENVDYAYAFKADQEHHKLSLYIFIPVMVARPGFEGTHNFVRGEWRQIYVAALYEGTKKITEKGEHNIEYYVPKFSDMLCLNAEGTLETGIEKVFSTWIKDYQTFFRILTSKGIVNRRTLSPEEIKYYFDTPTERFVLTGLTYAKITVFEAHNNPFLKAEVFSNGVKALSFIAGRSEFYIGERDGDIREILKKIYCCHYDNQKLLEFHQKVPYYNIKEYMESGGRNLLLPLLSERYDFCLEILLKSGCYSLIEQFYRHEKEVKSDCTDFVDIFRVPAKMLRRLSVNAAKESKVLTILEKTRQTAPEYLQGTDEINEGLIQFLKLNVLIPSGRRVITDIIEFKTLSKKKKLDIARSINRLKTVEGYTLFKDYLNMSRRLDEKFETVIGDITDIKDKHDEVMERYTQMLDRGKNALFEKIVKDETYKHLEMKDGNDKYMVVRPKSLADIKREGKDMNNCVECYIPQVLESSCQILYLREKEAPNKSYGTLEIRADSLYQAKARFNGTLPKEAQEYLKWYCKEKQLKIATRDISCA